MLSAPFVVAACGADPPPPGDMVFGRGASVGSGPEESGRRVALEIGKDAYSSIGALLNATWVPEQSNRRDQIGRWGLGGNGAAARVDFAYAAAAGQQVIEPEQPARAIDAVRTAASRLPTVLLYSETGRHGRRSDHAGRNANERREGLETDATLSRSNLTHL